MFWFRAEILEPFSGQPLFIKSRLNKLAISVGVKHCVVETTSSANHALPDGYQHNTADTLPLPLLENE